MEIEKKPNSPVTQLQVREQLRGMNRQHPSYSFNFDDNTIRDEQVKTQANIKLNPVETDRHRMFSEHGEPIPAEQVR